MNHTAELIFGISFLVVNVIAILALIFQAGQFKGNVDIQIRFLIKEIADMKEEMRVFNEQCKENILKGKCK